MSAQCVVCGRHRTGLVNGRCPTLEECEAWARDVAAAAAQATTRLATRVKERWVERTVTCTLKLSPFCVKEYKTLCPPDPAEIEKTVATAKCLVCARWQDSQRLEQMKIDEARLRRRLPSIARLEQEADEEYERLRDAEDRERAAGGRGPRAPQFVRDRFKR